MYRSLLLTGVLRLGLCTQEQTLGESGSSLLDEKSATLPGGDYWSFHGILTPEEVRAIDNTESVIYGVVAGIADQELESPALS